MKKLIHFLFTLIIPVTIFAQANSGVIRGKIIDAKTTEPIGFVVVTLKQKGSSTPIKGCISEDDGTFVLNEVHIGSYTLEFSQMGYSDETRNITITTDNRKASVGTIRLKPDKHLLKEVVVTEQRAQMSFEIDKRVFTIDQNIAATGGSATDVLTDIPSVEVDNEGTVSLRGSESVTVWINGKSTGLTADNQGDILQQMPAGSIEKVEVITNPSAKHSPEGTAGIINIILKRDRKAGYYGSVQAGCNSDGGYNASGNINYSSGAVDAYASLNYRDNHNEGDGSSYTEYFERDRFQQQHSTNERNRSNLFARAGLTWRLTENDEFYTNLMAMKGDGDSKSDIFTYSGITSAGTHNEKRLRTTLQNNTSEMFNIDGGYIHRFGEGHLLDLSVSHHIWKSDRESEYMQSNENLIDNTTVGSYQCQQNDGKNKSTEIKLDYENKLSENTRIEAGYNGIFSREDNPTITYTDPEKSTVEAALYNRFIYNQDTHALYGSYSGRIGKFGYQLGIRGEYWRVKTRSINWEQKQSGNLPAYTDKDFFKLFPSLFLSYSLPHDHEIQINYTRRLRRPRGHQLNNFSNISDSTNISFGNPDLSPEYSNAYELNYIKNWENHTLSVSGYYRTTDDVIERISYNNDRIIYSTFENVASEQSAGLEIIGKNKLFRRLDLTTTVNLFYYKLDGFNYMIAGQQISGKADEHFSWNARTTASIILPWDITMQATGRYNAKRIVAQGYHKPSYSIDLGFRKSFNNSWSISMNVRDLLDSRKWKTVTESDSFRKYSENRHSGRRFNVTITYSFGNMKAKKSSKKNNEINEYDDYEEGDI